jgi:hypothetical protein
MSANTTLFEFLIGEWSVEFERLPEGANVGRRATVNADWFLDGTAILDQWRHLDASGAVNFRGATFRTYVPDKDLWYVLWMTPTIEGFSELYARRAGDEVRTSGRGKDPGGEFLERGTYSRISDGAFSFELVRSYENGPSFNPFVSFRAARVRTGKPPDGQQ